MANYDILGNIAILKFDKNTKQKKKKEIANKFLKEHKSILTILEKTGKFSGRLRKQKTNYLAGEKTKEALYKENDCIFRLNADTCYFSPRLSSERKEIADMTKKGENILVLFGGVAPYAIVIAKQKKANKIISIEISKECNKYAKENIKRNNVNVGLIQGDVRKVLPKRKEKFDRVVMPRPNLKDSFLDIVFPKIKKNGIIHYYGFYQEKEKNRLIELINKEAKKARKKVKILKIKKAGEIAPYKFRYRADIKL